MATEAHKFETIESESRISLGSTRFANRADVLNAFKNSFELRKIKDYEFTDYYYKDLLKSSREALNDTMIRARNWTKYTTADGADRKQPIQVVTSAPLLEVYRDIPFKMGGKKSTENFPTLHEALSSLEKMGLSQWIVIEKRNGEHYEINWGESKAKIAMEDVACKMETACFSCILTNRWYDSMVKVEVASFDKDKIVDAYKPILAALGADNSAVIGDPMISIAVKNLEKV